MWLVRRVLSHEPDTHSRYDEAQMITLASLSKTYASGAGRVTVLDGIDLSVDSNEILAVIGPSGAGKSTLARCVNLLE